MFESQASEVIELAKIRIQECVPEYSITWNSAEDHYPKAVYVLWCALLDEVALSWIEKNCPNAWFKPMFK